MNIDQLITSDLLEKVITPSRDKFGIFKNAYRSYGVDESGEVSFETLKRIERSHAVKLPLAVRSSLIWNSKPTVVSKDSAYKRQADLLTRLLRMEWDSYVRTQDEAKFAGYVPYEKWIEPVVLEGETRWLIRLNRIDPSRARPKEDEKGRFDGIWVKEKKGSTREIPLRKEKSFWFTHYKEKVGGNYAGYSEAEDCYEDFRNYMILKSYMMVALETVAFERMIGWGPWQKPFNPETNTTEEYPGYELLLVQMELLRSFGKLALPSDTDEKGNRKWAVDTIKGEPEMIEICLRVLDVYLDSISRAWMVVPKVSRSPDDRVRTATEITTLFLITEQASELDLKEVKNQASDYWLEDMVKYNVGGGLKKVFSIELNPVSYSKRQSYWKLVETVVEKGWFYGLNFKKLFSDLEIPVEEYEAYDEGEPAKGTKLRNEIEDLLDERQLEGSRLFPSTGLPPTRIAGGRVEKTRPLAEPNDIPRMIHDAELRVDRQSHVDALAEFSNMFIEKANDWLGRVEEDILGELKGVFSEGVVLEDVLSVLYEIEDLPRSVTFALRVKELLAAGIDFGNSQQAREFGEVVPGVSELALQWMESKTEEVIEGFSQKVLSDVANMIDEKFNEGADSVLNTTHSYFEELKIKDIPRIARDLAISAINKGRENCSILIHI